MKLKLNDRVKITLKLPFFGDSKPYTTTGTIAKVYLPYKPHKARKNDKVVIIKSKVPHYEVRLDQEVIATMVGDFQSINPEFKRTDKEMVKYLYVSDREIVDSFPHTVASQISSYGIKQILAHRWKNLIFRRVGEIAILSRDLEKITYLDPFGEEKIHNVSGLTPEEKKQNVAFFYRKFCGVTKPTDLRSNDIYGGKSIRFSNSDYSEIDFEKTFRFGERKDHHEVPRPGMLLCGLVKRGSGDYYYDRWFSCSETFYKLWTIIQYNPTDVYPRKNTKSQILKKLHNNNSLWWIRNNSEASVMEKKERFHRIRTEAVSRKYHNIYQSTALLTVYYTEDSESEVNSYLSLPDNFIIRMKEGLMWVLN